ncbi:MAG: hypothetical protein GVY04_20875 [Cyanobacteria bacterium]|jgi:hypothetical protein|nr:hypothetical protein [Cyanobacteria bacterium GSL.Bin1]
MKSRFQALKLIRQVGIELLTAEQALENQQEPEVESLTRAEKKRPKLYAFVVSIRFLRN